MGDTLTGGKEPPEPQGSILAPLFTIVANDMTEGTDCLPPSSLQMTQNWKDQMIHCRAVIH